MKEKVTDPNRVKRALVLAGFKVAGHPILKGRFVIIECFLDPALSRSPSDNLQERAAPALNRWRTHGVSWNQAGNHLLVFIGRKRRTGRPPGPERSTDMQAATEFELREAGLSYQAIREKLYPKDSVEIDAIKQRVRRYAKRHGQS